MKNLVIIFGYNNTRIYDIVRLKMLCKTTFSAEIMLCKNDINEHDKKITPYTLEIDLTMNDIESIRRQIQIIDDYIYFHKVIVIGCLPFSDKGIPLGSYYARHKGLRHDDCERSIACIDKYAFRCIEKEVSTPKWYKKPFFKKIHSVGEAKQCIQDTNFPLFFKPIAEGNSRGCIEISSLHILEENLDIITPYLEQGILVEECIKNHNEYSFDGINGSYIITEKKTSDGYFRVETQHILPAPLPHHLYQRLITAGKIISSMIGSNGGAVHHEMFLNPITGSVYCVEPNRRPAGLKLWDWIHIANSNRDNNWIAWLNWAIKKTDNLKAEKYNYYVGCRMLTSRQTGAVHSINAKLKSKIQQINNLCDLQLTKSIGEIVTDTPKENGDFIGYFVCKDLSYDGLIEKLNEIEKLSEKIYIIAAVDHYADI